MHRLNPRRWLLAPIALIATASMIAARPLPECSEAAASKWVVANHDSLPTTVGGLSRYSRAKQRAILRHLSVTQRHAIWREHFALVLKTDNALSAAQRALIAEVSANLDTITTSDSLLNAYEQRAKRLFSAAVGGPIFYQVAPEPAPTVAQAGLWKVVNVLSVTSTRITTAVARSAGDCECNASDDWCAFGQHCVDDGNCDWDVWPGCGWLGSKICNGSCKLNGIEKAD